MVKPTVRFLHDGHLRDPGEIVALSEFVIGLVHGEVPSLAVRVMKPGKHDYPSGWAHQEQTQWATLLYPRRGKLRSAMYAMTVRTITDSATVLGHPHVCWHAVGVKALDKRGEYVERVTEHGDPFWTFEAFDEYQRPAQEAWARGERMLGRWPIYVLHNWREAFVHTFAHELNHIVQYHHGRKRHSEVGCERFALYALESYRRSIEGTESGAAPALDGAPDDLAYHEQEEVMTTTGMRPSAETLEAAEKGRKAPARAAATSAAPEAPAKPKRTRKKKTEALVEAEQAAYEAKESSAPPVEDVTDEKTEAEAPGKKAGELHTELLKRVRSDLKGKVHTPPKDLYRKVEIDGTSVAYVWSPTRKGVLIEFGATMSDVPSAASKGFRKGSRSERWSLVITVRDEADIDSALAAMKVAKEIADKRKAEKAKK
jgi:hypothetical protein